MNRGDIYYIKSLNTKATGSEHKSDRPAIIVSNDIGNHHSSVVEVVYLTGMQNKKQLPTHVRIKSAKIPSIALCEQVFTVAKERIQDCIGHISQEEQKQMDHALMVSFGIQEEKEYE